MCMVAIVNAYMCVKENARPKGMKEKMCGVGVYYMCLEFNKLSETLSLKNIQIKLLSNYFIK